MLPYLTHKANTYYFRQAVPAELRAILGKREIKKSLGRDYVAAVRDCKRFAVEADNQLADARAQLDSQPVVPFSREGIRRTRHVSLTRVTPELETLFGSLMRASLLETDQETRIAGMDRDAFAEYGQHLEDAIAALRRQLAMGNVDPMLDATRLFLVGRGYQPEFSADDWRRLAYVMTQATLQAYEGMAARQQGTIVASPTETVLPSQYEVQNASLVPTVTPKEMITWTGLYEVWVSECERRENTKAAYLAAMKLFNSFCAVAPQVVTRNHVLDFRDFLLGQSTEGLSGPVGVTRPRGTERQYALPGNRRDLHASRNTRPDCPAHRPDGRVYDRRIAPGHVAGVPEKKNDIPNTPLSNVVTRLRVLLEPALVQARAFPDTNRSAEMNLQNSS